MKKTVGAGIVGLALAMAAPAHADPAGDRVLAASDEAQNRARTLSFEYEAVVQEAGKSERTMGLKLLVKGEKRLFEFTSPADMKGTKVLILSPTQMYVYLPAFGKVRRIASHTQSQGFLGLAFSADDLARAPLSPSYAGQLLRDVPASWTVTATPKSGQETPYGKIELDIGKDKSLPGELRYFNTAGARVKTETRTNYACEGNVCTARETKMVDNTRAGTWTKLVQKSVRVNEALSDDLFSKRSLEN